MPSFNQCTFVGNLVRDPELKTAQSGSAYARAGLAVNGGYGEKKTVLFLNFTCFGKTAEALQKYAKKGDPLLITGELECNEVAQESGEKRYYWQLRVARMQFLGGNKKKGAPEPANQSARAPQEQSEQQSFDGQNFDEIPF